jgi:thiosulfate/3-mercaptopyruvate sulfurtransferase
VDDLIDPDELAAVLATLHPPVLLDVRWSLAGPPGVQQYAEGHLPGAVFVDLDRDLAGRPGARGRHPLPDPGALQDAMRRWGISAGTPVVVYDAADSTSAARAWWVLRWAGHQPVRVLDGGLGAWRRSGRPVVDEVPTPPAGDVSVQAGDMPTLDAAGAADVARTGRLLDARSPQRYRGEQEPVDPVAGHVPGARNAPTTGNVDATGRFLPPEQLHERFAALGVSDGVSTGAYCGSGVTAAHEVLALRLAGVPAALYVGSWSEWVRDPDRPVATGEQP